MKKFLLIILSSIITFLAYGESEIIAFHLNNDNGLPDNNIQSIRQDSIGYIYFYGRYNVFRYDGYNCEMLSDESLAQTNPHGQFFVNSTNKVFSDNLGNKAVLLPDGNLTYTKRDTKESYTFNVATPQLLKLTQRVKCTVITDRRGLVWVSTNGCGLRIFNPHTGELKIIDRNYPGHIINTDHIVSMMEDRDGNIWIAGEYHGVTCLNMRQRNYSVIDINTTGAEKSSEVRMLHRLGDGRIVVADMVGMVGISSDELKTISHLNLDGRNYISACVDGNGELWLGSRNNGLNIHGENYGKGRVDCILKDRKGRMWLCGINSALKRIVYSERNYKEYSYLDDIPKLAPRVLLEDSRGDFWLGTKKGLYVFNPDSLICNPKSYTKIMDRPIMCLYESANRDIWIGTMGEGVFYGSNKTCIPDSFTQLSTNDGLTNDMVQLIAEDMNHNICIGTEKGISFVEHPNGQIHNLMFFDSKLRNTFTERNAVRLADGRMAFGSLDGIIVIDGMAGNVIWNHRPIVTGLDINGVPVHNLGDEKPFDGDVSQCRQLNLAHNQNTLTFRFSDLDFGGHQKGVFMCMLEGFDKDWVSLYDQHATTYKNLSPGTYTLYVRSKQSGQAVPLVININPPVWATWWAYLIYAVITLIVILGILRQLRRMNELNQRIAVEKQMTEYKLRFFTNISHEFRTPLTLIQGTMESIESVKTVPSDLHQPLKNMKRNVERMLRLINQLLEFRRMQNGKLTLSLQKTDVVCMLYNIYISFHSISENRNINYQFRTSHKKLEIYVDRGYLDKIAYNLLSNAFKYTPKGGTITLEVSDTDGQLCISVTDSGVGIPKGQQAGLFERYATGKLTYESIGIGLNLTQELVRVHHGQISYEENPSGGSIFKVQLPIDESVYQPSDFMHTDTALHEGDDLCPAGFDSVYKKLADEPMNNYNVLIVEDNDDVSEMLRTELGKYFRITTATDGVEGLEILNRPESNFSLIISDVMMPRMDGFEFTRKVRADKELHSLPVILLTALNAEEKQEKGLSEGADVYIGKPFSIKVLTAQCVTLIRQREMLKIAYSSETGAKPALPQIIRDEKDKKFITTLDTLIESQMKTQSLSVDVMAEKFGMSRTSFYNKVRGLTGCTPNDYLRDKRLERAAEMLRTENATVSEVSYETGFSTPQYFATIFKKKFGMSPTDYQRGKEK